MKTMTPPSTGQVIGGVDTHKDVHVAAVIDNIGRIQGVESFPTTVHGYRRLLVWLQSYGELLAVGVEGCGSWCGPGAVSHRARGAGGGGAPAEPSEASTARQVRHRRRRGRRSSSAVGRSDRHPQGRQRSRRGVTAVAYRRSGAIKARTAAANQIHSLCDTAPEELRARLRGRSLRKKVAVCERWRPGTTHSPDAAAKRALVSVAHRWRGLDGEIVELDAHLKAILNQIAAPLLALRGVGYDAAGQLLVTAGDNPHRWRAESSYAALCASSPVKASSDKTRRQHRLNRGGDRQANSALWTIVLSRMSNHPPTRDYVERRTKEGLSKPEIKRCLKRYVAREVFPHVRAISVTNRTTNVA